MNIEEWAKNELDLLLKDCEDEESKKMQEKMNNDILEIIRVFSSQNHSGFSANYAMEVLYRLLKWKPLKPLTGEEDEWGPLEYGVRQNKRCFSVFQNEDGITTDNDAIIVSDDGGMTWFTTSEFRKEITFPYDPKSEPEKVYLDCDEVITNNPERIKEVYERRKNEMEYYEK